MMKFLFFSLLVFSVWSCTVNGLKEESVINDETVTDTMASADEELYYEVSGDGEPEDTLPVKDLMAERYPNILQLVSKLETALLEHNEEDVISLCDPENYAEQKEMGIGKFQYVYEILNIEGQEFKDEDNYKKYCKKFLKAITGVEWVTFDGISGASNNEYYLFGNLTTGNGDVVLFSITLMYDEGDYLITGAVG